MLAKFAIAMAMVLLLPRMMERLRLPGVLGLPSHKLGRRAPPGRRVCERRLGAGGSHLRDRPDSD